MGLFSKKINLGKIAYNVYEEARMDTEKLSQRLYKYDRIKKDIYNNQIFFVIEGFIHHLYFLRNMLEERLNDDEVKEVVTSCIIEFGSHLDDVNNKEEKDSVNTIMDMTNTMHGILHDIFEQKQETFTMVDNPIFNLSKLFLSNILDCNEDEVKDSELIFEVGFHFSDEVVKNKERILKKIMK